MKNNPTKYPAKFTLIAAFALSLAVSRGQEAATNASAALPGKGLAQHDFFYAGEAKTRDMYIVRGGKAVWAYHDFAGKGEISDAQLLANGNVLFAHQFAVTLISPDKKLLWNYDAPPKCEIHTAQMIGTNHVIFIQNGPEPKIFVANLATGQMDKEISLNAGNNNSTHGQFRHARLTEAGTYLVAHMDMGKLLNTMKTAKSFGRRRHRACGVRRA